MAPDRTEAKKVKENKAKIWHKKHKALLGSSMDIYVWNFTWVLSSSFSYACKIGEDYMKLLGSSVRERYQ